MAASEAATAADVAVTPATAQPLAEQVLGAGQAALDGAHRPAKQAGGLFVGPAVQEAQHHGVAVLARQAGQLVVQDRAEVEGRIGRRRAIPDRFGRHGVPPFSRLLLRARSARAFFATRSVTP